MESSSLCEKLGKLSGEKSQEKSFLNLKRITFDELSFDMAMKL